MSVALYEPSDFKELSAFFLSRQNVLLNSPVRNNVSYLYGLIEAETSLVFDSKNVFLEYLKQFNELTNNSLCFSGEPSRLELINEVNLRIFNKRLCSESLLPVAAKTKPQETLLEFLEVSVHTFVEYEDGTQEMNPDTLSAVLNSPTAQSILSKKRAKYVTQRKPFYEVCSSRSHGSSLAKAMKSKKNGCFVSIRAPSGSKEKCFTLGTISKDVLSSQVQGCCQNKIHFIPIINKYTDTTLGDCSYLDTCHKMASCRYLHYYTLVPSSHKQAEDMTEARKLFEYTIGDCNTEFVREVLPAQWINCDVRYFPLKSLGKFAAIISDPAWDIHMSLPYGTCKDFELLNLPMHVLQDEGIFLLWVTGRSIEVGRKALQQWGYRISDEMIWVKLNQLKRTIVTGRTGHWLNHSKEHLLVGIKGNPAWINRLADIDVIVSNTRQTLRKPEELYDIVERIVGKHSRKLEMFGRDHNIRPGWITIGNQITGTSVYERQVKDNMIHNK